MAEAVVARRGARFKDITGHRFGRLVVVGEIASTRAACRWRLKCDCGGETFACTGSLNKGEVRSCGCGKRDRRPRLTHGASCRGQVTPEYRAWVNMIRRCESTGHISYPDYGGRDIHVCPRWRNDFPAFLADVGQRPGRGYSLDRKNNNGHYELGNVKWSTRTEQNRNRRITRKISYCGEELTLGEISERTGASVRLLAARLARGWSIERAATIPARHLKAGRWVKCHAVGKQANTRNTTNALTRLAKANL
jgi:hypothetical protein